MKKSFLTLLEEEDRVVNGLNAQLELLQEYRKILLTLDGNYMNLKNHIERIRKDVWAKQSELIEIRKEIAVYLEMVL